MTCRIDNEEQSSEKLLYNDECLKSIDTYAIRYHDAIKRGPHFDYCLGNKNDDVCIDFILPRRLTQEQKKEKISNLPEKGTMLLIFQPPHDIYYLTAKIGEVHEIPVGEYGAGKWWMVKRGKAKVKREGNIFNIWLDDVQYVLFPTGKGKERRYLLRKK